MSSVSHGVQVGHCHGCGVLIEGCRRNRKWCSERCRVAAWRAKNGSSDPKAADVRAARVARNLELPDIECGYCGSKTPRSSVGVPRTYCSKACQKKGYYRQSRLTATDCAYGGCDRPAHAKGLCGSHYAGEWSRENRDRRRTSGASYHARKRGNWVEDVSRETVLDRDGWICHICDTGIDRGLTFPSRGYGTMDHVVPLNRGGEHSYANVKAAHWICNSLKRDTLDFKAAEPAL